MTIKALTFDVFGTVVDWRSSVIRDGERLGKRKGLDIDWAAFADAWRGGYGPSMNRVRTGELPWTKIDDLHRMILDELLEKVRHIGIIRRRDRRIQPRLAPPRPLARCRRRLIAVKIAIPDRHTIQRQCIATRQHGEIRRTALGLHLFRRIGWTLQTRCRNLFESHRIAQL